MSRGYTDQSGEHEPFDDEYDQFSIVDANCTTETYKEIMMPANTEGAELIPIRLSLYQWQLICAAQPNVYGPREEQDRVTGALNDLRDHLDETLSVMGDQNLEKTC